MRQLAEFVPEMSRFEEYLCSKFEEGLNLEIREKMSVSGSQNYKEVVQLALRAEKLANEQGAKGKFQKRKGFGSYLDNLLRKVKVLSLLVIHQDQVQNRLVRPRQFDLHNHRDLVHPRQVLLLEDELQQKGVSVVVRFIQDLVVLLKCVSNVDKPIMSKGFVQCQIQLLQRDKLWVNLEL